MNSSELIDAENMTIPLIEGKSKTSNSMLNAESEGEGNQQLSVLENETNNDGQYNDYIQLLLQEIEDLENEIKVKKNREVLENQQRLLTKKFGKFDYKQNSKC